MLDQIKRKRDLGKTEYKELVPELRSRLIILQQELRKQKFPVLVLFAGVDGAGKHETVDLLNTWMDPRWLITRAYGQPTEDERQRPTYWRYWRDLPPHGQLGLYLSAWYSRPLLDYVKGKITLRQFNRHVESINAFERNLTDNGALILKYYMLLDKKGQEKRLKKLASDPLTAWQVKPTDWENWALYDRFIDVSDQLISATHIEGAEWQVIDSSAQRRRSIEVAESIHTRIEQHIESGGRDIRRTPTRYAPAKRRALDEMSMKQSLTKTAYKEELSQLSARLYQLQHQAYLRHISAVVMFEGWDAAGKGGVIRRLTGAMDARHYQVIPIAAPTDEEKAHHYLWRFWRHLPRAGRVTLYDRSWYGRVLVERVEGFAKDADWQRAYREINEFEKELVDSGIVLCKFWMHITQEEQLRRFKEREQIAYKAWKLTDEDWRNREKWDDYTDAVHDMVELTGTPEAPWTLVEGDQKYFARIKVMREVCRRLEDALDRCG